MKETKEVEKFDCMTNEEYRVELQKIFNNVENNRLLRYFCFLLPKLIKEWQ